MCGILGIVNQDCAPVDTDLLERMTDVLAHRGPDGRGFVLLDPDRRRASFWSDRFPEGQEPSGPIALGHRRLSIVDLEDGAQPMCNEEGTVWITYNGEVYNAPELRRELQILGHRFKTDHSDTETIVHAYEQWGTECLHRLRGMFAFGLVDLGRRRLFLARDRVGVKPLVYRASRDRFTFASELKALVHDGSVSKDVDPAALGAYFSYGYVPAPATIYKGISKLSPGHYLVMDLDGPYKIPRPVPYWDVTFEPDESVDEDAWSERLMAELSEAIRIRLVSDVPLGAFLSGGVDSSTVVALASRVQKEPLKTFTIGFEEAGFDETAYARQVARQYGTEHHEEVVRPNAIEVLPELAWHYDEPFADFSAVPTYYVCQMARKRVTVALSGDGGDETFGGYTRYARYMRFHRWVDRVPYFLRRMVFGGIRGLLPPTVRGRDYAALASLQEGQRYQSLVSLSACRQILKRNLRSHLDGDAGNGMVARLWREGNGRDPVSRMQYVDFKSYLPEDILTKVDRASMLHSLEVRVPMLDHKVIELAAKIPVRLKLNGNEGKYILKKMMEDELGRCFLRRRKRGFSVPLARWFRGDLKDAVAEDLLGANSFITPYVDPQAVRSLLWHHGVGSKDLAPVIWRMLFLEHWGRCHVAGEGPPSDWVAPPRVQTPEPAVS